MCHTILMVQPGKRPQTRSFSDFETVDECMEGICKMFEERLKTMNPHSKTISYDIKDLFKFIDRLVDLSCLVYQESTMTYAPYNKEWIKEQVYDLLKRQADESE